MREANEDALEVFISEPGAEPAGFFAIADGMGGHEGGADASRVAVRRARRAFLEWQPENGELESWLDDLYASINETLRTMAIERDIPRGMGTTLTIAIVRDGTLVLGHIGDSRCYRLRDDRLDQLSEDHSWVAEQRRAGLLTEAEEQEHVDRHVLTQCLGIDDQLDVFLRREVIAVGDRYLLTSDGVHGVIDDSAIARVLSEEPDPQSAARRLLNLAETAGSADNETAVVFDIRPVDADTVEIVTESADDEYDSVPAAAGGRIGLALIAGGMLVLGIGIGSGVWSLAGHDPIADQSAPAATIHDSLRVADSTVATETLRSGGRDSVHPDAPTRAPSDTTG